MNRPQMSGNDIALTQLAADTALAIWDRNEDADAYIDNSLCHGHEMRITMGDGDPHEVYNPHFWIADDEAPLFRQMVDLALDGLRRGDDTFMIYRDRLLVSARKRLQALAS